MFSIRVIRSCRKLIFKESKVINCMSNNKKIVLMVMLLIFLVGYWVVVRDEEKISVSEIIEKGEVEIEGSSYNIYVDSVENYKYDGENLTEQSDHNRNLIFYYDENRLSKKELYNKDKLIITSYYTYDSSGNEIRVEIVDENTKDKSYSIKLYEKNYKETSYYDSNDELLSVVVFELNDKQQVLKFRSKSKDGSSDYETYFEYENDNKIFERMSNEHGVLRESYFKYNEFGDLVSLIIIRFTNTKMPDSMYYQTLNFMYYDNEYDDSKLVRKTTYSGQTYIDEDEVMNIEKSLK